MNVDRVLALFQHRVLTQPRVRVRLLVRSAYLRFNIDPILPVLSADPMPRTSRRIERYSYRLIGPIV